MTKIAILGGTGYTALELIKILLRHPHAEIVAVTSRDEKMPAVAESHPSLAGRIKLRMEPFDVDKLVAKGVECVFGCLPHGASSDAIAPLLKRGMRVIDLSADSRLRDPNVYAQWYGESHHDLANLAKAVYGLPEIYGDDIKSAQLVANPGCYPQTGILGLAPLVAGKYVGLKDIIIDAKSGVSGGGRTPKLNFHFPECNESVVAYGVGTHRHTPEIEQALSDVAGEAVEVIFTPHLIPMDRGIFTTIYATPHRAFTESQLLDLYRAYYANAPFVRVTSQVPATKDSTHSNFIDMTVRVVRGRIVVLVAEDNLVRGASGVAVQNFNRMYGYEEKAGLQ
ncbi:MAG: N-acetyl-gamma-glutamyl-phosphate reductase [Planctomycetes bacterium]|nr:N-acetyl-gamma-glutamyl-phosphate reductase [Planctomycetota bacterium]